MHYCSKVKEITIPVALPIKFSPRLPTEISEGVVVRATQFGQGYVQRSPETINSSMRSVSLKFLLLNKAAVQELSQFLNDRAIDPMIWQAPDSSSTELWLAKVPFKKTYIANNADGGAWEVSCDFEKVAR